MRSNGFRTTLPMRFRLWRRNVLGVLPPRPKLRLKAEAANAEALVSHSEELITRLKPEIEKVRREL
ncbi:MAG: hypothetical protein BGO05_18210 [Rhizobiales bacterium 63-7]|nr:MAG: hypothetical protein BGO05_18210 [Rhizobiales bacterium 63-7]